MRPRVKICGITNTEDALTAVTAGADALGFIFYRKSPRYVEPAVVREIVAGLPPFISTVGVFVNEARETVNRIVEETGIRLIQLHGNESCDECRDYPVKVIKVFRIRSMDMVPQIRTFPISAALLDGASDDQYGGSGKTADPSVALEIKRYFPLILSGGLGPNNVLEAIRAVQPYAIDVNSGIESDPGKKDQQKIRELFERLSELPLKSRAGQARFA